MPRKAVELGDLAVRRLKEPGMHFVGGVAGLALQVLPTGGRTWVLRMTVGTKRRDMGLGGYPDVTLAQARDKARAARERVRVGVDPVEEARAARSALKAQQASAITFKQCAERYIAAHKSGWKNAKHVQQWENTLIGYVYPIIGDLIVGDVSLSHILNVLEPIWREKTETASRIRGRIESVLDWATVRRHRSGENPARWRGHLDKLFPAKTKINAGRNFPALPIKEAGAFMAELRKSKGQGARALEFLILTAVRSQNVRAARWSEIDLERGVWMIPGLMDDAEESTQRMKTGRDHRVPLSADALRLLKSIPRVANVDLLFPSPKGAVLSDMTITKVIRAMNESSEKPRWVDPKQGNRPVVPHGFRSTFRDWAAEMTDYPHEMAEVALAHVVGDKVEAAYRRGDMFEKRRHMMTDWAEFLATKQPRIRSTRAQRTEKGTA